MRFRYPEDFWVCVVFALAAFMVAVILKLAPAHGHEPHGSAAHRDWFFSQYQEETPARCCGELEENGGDARYVAIRVADGKYFVQIDGSWVLYPKPVNPYHENPTGRGVVWLKATEGGYVFYCLRLATGA